MEYPHKSGPHAGFSGIGIERQNEVRNTLIAAQNEGLEPIAAAVEKGIPPLTAATGLIALINEHIYAQATVELTPENNSQEDNVDPTSSEV